MRKKIDISIIIVNFNTITYLEKCLTSLNMSNLPKDCYEIIVVDNASSDGSVQLIKSKYDGVKLIVNDKNIGFAKANNQAIKSARGDYILILNPDTVVKSDSLDLLLTYLNNNKQVGIVTCKVELANGRLDDACHRGFPTPWRAFCQFIGLSALFTESQFFNGYHLGYAKMHDIHEIESCAGAFMMVRFSAGKKVSWFDEDYFWYGEDLDFCYRIKKEGWKIIYYPFTKVLHYKGISSGIKKHSSGKSTADYFVKRQATLSRFAVMRLFYFKHLSSFYPQWLTQAITLAITIKEKINLIRIKFIK